MGICGVLEVNLSTEFILFLFLLFPFFVILDRLREIYYKPTILQTITERFSKLIFYINILFSSVASVVTFYFMINYWGVMNSPLDSVQRLSFGSNFFSFWEIKVDILIVLGLFVIQIAFVLCSKFKYSTESKT